MGEEYQWHDRYTHSPTRRIVRVEVVAQVRTYIIINLHTRGPDLIKLLSISGHHLGNL